MPNIDIKQSVYKVCLTTLRVSTHFAKSLTCWQNKHIVTIHEWIKYERVKLNSLRAKTARVN